MGAFHQDGGNQRSYDNKVREVTNESHERVSLSQTENDQLLSHQNRHLITNDIIGKVPWV